MAINKGSETTWEDLARELHKTLGLRGQVNGLKILKEVEKLKSNNLYQSGQIRELNAELSRLMD